MISIILPAYKKRFLKEAIQSILAQSLKDFELIVVDDASPENLQSVISSFSDNRLTYIKNPNNIGRSRGLVTAWNRALSFASGDWIVLASDDDVYRPLFLEEMMRYSEKYPNVKAIHCRMAATNADGSLRWVGGG